MAVKISGVLKDGTGKPVQNCTIQLKAKRNSTTVVVNTVASENPDEAGRYSMDVEYGQYSVTLLVEGFPPSHAGTITVCEGSRPGTLNDFLGAMTEDDVCPEALRRFELMVEEVARNASAVAQNTAAAKKSARDAGTSASEAATNATDAAGSARAASTSAGSAASSASSASASKDEATKQASAAKGSATTASSKATESAGSATAAAQSKSAAESAAMRAETAAKRAEDIADVVSLEDASTTKKGIVQLSSATNSASESLAATAKAVKVVMDETNKKAPLNSPALTGTPTTPTAPKGTNNTQIASTAYVMAAIAALVDSSPDALNTLNELAAALAGLATAADRFPYFTGNDVASLATLTKVGRDILAKSTVAAVIEYLGLQETVNKADNAVQKTGDTLSGGLTFENDSILAWIRNTDWAKIGFKNDSDADTDSYMWFETADNGNEYFKWRHRLAGGRVKDLMNLKWD
ncbi:phage tail protein, partial [Shigella boydii]|nr:phage tail protein [Shigella boydii]EFY9992466.1 phage tail protein [Shigella boydii]HCS1910926.1 prophage tail fiber N-terminal domain-containing protein [Shigella boydii]